MASCTASVNGNTPLHLAIKRKDQDLALALINQNQHIRSQDKQYYTPLHLAITYKMEDIALALIEHGAKIYY